MEDSPLDRQVRAALAAGLATMETLGKDAGLSPITVRRWHVRLYGAKPASAVKLAQALRRRALRMLSEAARLEALAELEAKGGTP